MFHDLGGDEKIEFLIHYWLLMIYPFIRVWKHQGRLPHLRQPDVYTLYSYVSSLKWIRA